jgi:cell division protein FtsI/penicillin-binding protein 2
MLGGVALLSLLAGMVTGARHEPAERKLAVEWGRDWERQDYRAMHALLTPTAQRSWPLGRFRAVYRSAAATATLTRLAADRPRTRKGLTYIPVTANTRIFGTVAGDVALPLADGPDGDPRVAWRPDLAFPGLRRGERLSRNTRMPARATIEARDGSPLAEGDSRTSPLGPAAADVAGRIGQAPSDRAAELAARGVPAGAPVGLTGLEREFDVQLAGTPGGLLRAGSRVIAVSSPRPGRDVRTTIDPDLQQAAVTALAGRYGGVAVVRPRDGEVLAMAGIASSAPQPPGSTFKIVTLAAALASRVAKPSSSYPVQSSAVLDGVELRNANGESCGGTLMEAFAESCNSVFAPLGVAIGARRLVATAQRFGFNEDVGIAGAARPTIPPADEVGDDLAVGSTAIGQGKVLTTPLHMALVASTIADHGRRPRATLLRGRIRERTRAISPHVARIVARGMREVVTSGTGTSAAVPGVTVAGKTGTAELRSTVPSQPTDPSANPEQQLQEDTSDTDAWFTAYAPAQHPKVAVCVLLVAQGAGGATAAPVARVVLEAAT